VKEIFEWLEHNTTVFGIIGSVLGEQQDHGKHTLEKSLETKCLSQLSHD
jgi:hypothetical protein